LKQKILVLSGLATLALISLFYQLGSLPFVGADEPRYARVAEEMILRGDYVTPTLEFRPWLEKPPLLYWCEATAFDLFGVSEWSARLPNALLALIGMAAAAWLALRIRGFRAACLTFAMMSTSLLWIVFGRAASTDAPLAVTLSISLIAGYMANISSSWSWFILAGGSLGLAVLAKGPLATAMFFMVLVANALLIREEFRSTARLAVAALIFFVVSVPWYAWVWLENGENFFWTFWVNHNLARFVTDIHHHRQPFWFYLPILLAGTFPWILFLGPSFRRLWKNRFNWRDPEERAQLFLWVWLLVPLFFFSLSRAKLPGYILPVVPAAVILAALEWDRFLNGEERRKSAVPAVLAVLGSIIVFAAVLIGLHRNYGQITILAAVAVPLLLGTFVAHCCWIRSKLVGAFAFYTAGNALTLVLILALALPVMGSFHSPKSILARAEPYLSVEQPLILYRYFQLTAHYYSGYRTTKGEVYSPENLVEYASRHPQPYYYLLTQDQGLEELKRLFQGEILDAEGNLYLVRIPPPKPLRSSATLQGGNR